MVARRMSAVRHGDRDDSEVGDGEEGEGAAEEEGAVELFLC